MKELKKLWTVPLVLKVFSSNNYKLTVSHITNMFSNIVYYSWVWVSGCEVPLRAINQIQLKTLPLLPLPLHLYKLNLNTFNELFYVVAGIFSFIYFLFIFLLCITANNWFCFNIYCLLTYFCNNHNMNWLDGCWTSGVK